MRDISKVAVDKSPEMDGGTKVWWFSRLSQTCANHRASQCAGLKKGCSCSWGCLGPRPNLGTGSGIGPGRKGGNGRVEIGMAG
jgi:hypothetical protein